MSLIRLPGSAFNLVIPTNIEKNLNFLTFLLDEIKLSSKEEKTATEKQNPLKDRINTLVTNLLKPNETDMDCDKTIDNGFVKRKIIKDYGPLRSSSFKKAKRFSPY